MRKNFRNSKSKLIKRENETKSAQAPRAETPTRNRISKPAQLTHFFFLFIPHMCVYKGQSKQARNTKRNKTKRNETQNKQ